MIYILVSKYFVTDTNQILYMLHSYDESDIYSLIPDSECELLTLDELTDLYKRESVKCKNFKIINNSLQLENEIPTFNLPESSILIPTIGEDDIWNLLYRLSKSNSVILMSNAETQHDGFTDKEATYIVNPKTFKYSNTHANCSVQKLISGKVTLQDCDEIQNSKRWTTYKFIKNNKLMFRYLVVITTQTELEKITEFSQVKVKSFSLESILKLNTEMLNTLEDESDLLYCIFDLESIPLVNHNKVLTSNYHYICDTVQLCNYTRMFSKTLRAFIDELCYSHEELKDVKTKDTVYESPSVPDTKEYNNGVKFSLAGQSSIPSVNSCIKALNRANVTSVKELMELPDEELQSIKTSLYNLNIMQKSCIEMLLQLIHEYRSVKNPTTSYYAADRMYKLYLEQYELFKLRLTYLRSIFMATMPEELFAEEKSFKFSRQDNTVFISFGKFKGGS